MPLPKKESSMDRQSAKTLVFNTMKEWIIDGTFKPGEKITETELAEYFMVSRTPIREALQLLSEIDLVDIVPNKGTTVSLIDEDNLRQVYEALSYLHSAALDLAFDRLGEQEIKKLEDYNNQMLLAARKGKFWALPELDSEFHQIIIDCSENSYIIRQNKDLLIHVLRAENLSFSELDSSMRSIEEHRAIIGFIKNHDRESAINMMRQNWLHFKKN